MSKIKTNEQLLRGLLKGIDTIEAGLLRERLLTISKVTRQNIKDNPGAFNVAFVHESQYVALCDKIDKALNVDQ